MYANLRTNLPTESRAERFFGKDNATPDAAPAPRGAGAGAGAGAGSASAPAPETQQPAAGTGVRSEEDYLKKINDYRGDAPGPMQQPDLAAQKKEDMWATLAQIGFGTAAGTSPNALVNLGKGAAEAMPGMQKAMDRRREAQREAMKAEYEYKLRLWGVKGEDFKAARDMYMKDVDADLKRQQLAETAAQNKEENRLKAQQIDVSREGVRAQLDTDPFRWYTDPSRTEEERALADKYFANKSLFRDTTTNLAKRNDIRAKYKDQLNALTLQARQPGAMGEKAAQQLKVLEGKIAQEERAFDAARLRFTGADTPAVGGTFLGFE